MTPVFKFSFEKDLTGDLFLKQVQNCRTWLWQIAKTVCDRMVETDSNWPEIKSERPLAEGMKDISC